MLNAVSYKHTLFSFIYSNCDCQDTIYFSCVFRIILFKLFIWFVWLQVGVIRPISRDSDTLGPRSGARSESHRVPGHLEKENKVIPPHVNRNNKVNKIDQELNNEKKKETLIIDKDPLVVPIESWKENNTQVLS